jgi:hypothetical protein
VLEISHFHLERGWIHGTMLPQRDRWAHVCFASLAQG